MRHNVWKHQNAQVEVTGVTRSPKRDLSLSPVTGCSRNESKYTKNSFNLKYLLLRHCWTPFHTTQNRGNSPKSRETD